MTERREGMTARLVRRGVAERDFDRAFWAAQGAEARFAAAWAMVNEARWFRGEHGCQPRLQRSVQHIQRRGR